MRGVFCAVLALAALSCTSSGPSSPDDADPGQLSVLTVRAARGGQPVADATVVVSGVEYRTSGDGTVHLDDHLAGSVVELRADGFLQPRLFIYRPGRTDFLLPDDGQLPFSWLRAAWYDTAHSGGLWRPRPGTITVQLSREARDDAHMPGATDWAVRTINRAQSYVQYDIVTDGGAISMYRDPHDPVFREPQYRDAWAVIFVQADGGYITSARVVWKFFTRAGTDDHLYLDEAVAHELGHATGLMGHPPGGIMGSVWGLDDFSAREKEALNYAFLREPGTRPPDDSTSTSFVGPSNLRLPGSGGGWTPVCALRR